LDPFGAGRFDAVHVLFLNDLCDPRIGSSIRQMYQQAKCLRDLGHRTSIVSTAQAARDAGPTTIEGCPVERIHSSYNARFRAWIGLKNRAVLGPLRDILARLLPDVVHSQLIHTHLSYAALDAARDQGAGVVFTAHDVMTFCYQKLTCFHGGERYGARLRDYQAYSAKCIPCQRLRFRPGRNAAIRAVLERSVDRFTVVSDELGRAIRANGIRVDRTIHNGIRFQDALPSAESVAGFRARFGLEGRQVVTMAGRLHEQKGVGQMLAILAELVKRHPRACLLLLGDREIYDREFRATAERLGVAERIVATGWLSGDDLQCGYAASDVFATPSICFDTFGLVNLEAMEHGKPVVATCFGGSPEVVADGETGFVCNPFDVAGYAARIGRLLENPETARQMGARGRERARELFSIERLTREFLEEYETARRAVSSGNSPIRLAGSAPTPVHLESRAGELGGPMMNPDEPRRL
jgi:glycosyltransferase involved in cell wall biosynthesis